MVCVTLAFWLGRGTLICAKTDAVQHSANRTEKQKTELRLKEVMIFLLVIGWSEMIQSGPRQFKLHAILMVK